MIRSSEEMAAACRNILAVDESLGNAKGLQL